MAISLPPDDAESFVEFDLVACETLREIFFDALTDVQPSPKAAGWALATTVAYVCDIANLTPEDICAWANYVRTKKREAIAKA